MTNIATRSRLPAAIAVSAITLLHFATAAQHGPARAPSHTVIAPDDLAAERAGTTPIIAEVEGHTPQPSPRGPGIVVYDSITGCVDFTRFNAAPAAILDDCSFTPGPAAALGSTITGLDLMIRPFVEIPVIRIRVRVFSTITISGTGSPAIVQSELISSLILTVQGSQANITPGVYQVTAELPPFNIPGDTFGIEIAFIDANDSILANGQITAMFPAPVCALLLPAIGASQPLFWLDNDFGNLTGDGIRYEPPNPALPGIDQGDQLFWNPGGADNNLAIRLRGTPTMVSIGACCLTAAPYTCIVSQQSLCTGANQLYIGPGSTCDQAHCLPPPANDLCANAAPIAGFGEFFYDNLGATSSGPDDCPLSSPPSITRDVWYLWTAPCDGPVSLNTCRATLTDDKIAVYSGASCSSLSTAQLACDDDGCSIGTSQSSVTFPAIAGQSYLLRMGTWNDTPGAPLNGFRVERVDGPCPNLCPADWDTSGDVDVADIFAFLNAWFAGDPNALFYGGDLGVPAIFAFLNDWFAHGVGPC